MPVVAPKEVMVDVEIGPEVAGAVLKVKVLAAVSRSCVPEPVWLPMNVTVAPGWRLKEAAVKVTVPVGPLKLSMVELPLFRSIVGKRSAELPALAPVYEKVPPLSTMVPVS